jgi:hypothetical protein
VTSVFRSLAVTLALSAMLLRAMLPVGWMPDLAGTGAPLVICSVDGLHHIPQDPSHSHDDDHGYACPFAAAAHLAPPQLPPAIPQPFVMAQLAPRFAVPLLESHLHDPGHAPRGPPVSI